MKVGRNDRRLHSAVFLKLIIPLRRRPALPALREVEATFQWRRGPIDGPSRDTSKPKRDVASVLFWVCPVES